MIDFLKELNEPQQEAVMATEGPVMVIAGAGSGKTRVLTYRVAYLLSLEVAPFNILALTFTNKAAREMKERIASLVGPAKAKSLWMGTFHSIFARILRVESEKLGFPSNFTIYDTDDSKRLIRSIIKEQNLDDKTYSPGYVLGRISNAKNNLIGPIDYNEDFEIQNADTQARKPKLGLLYSIYQQRLRKASAMDFDDLLFNTNVLLRDFPDVLYKYQQKFSYILVDEYQDTNFSQYLIVKKLAANNENICVVGDDAQSIYAFRGANIANILNFKKDYPDFKLFKLEQNYRSTQNIVNAANSAIAHNKDQIFKKVWTHNDQGEKVMICKAANEAEEASWIAGRIFEWRAQHQLPNNAFAVLYRTNAQSRALEEALRKLNIPYRIFGGVSFYQRKEVKDVLAYFRLVINPKDEEAFMRVVNFPARGIGDTTLNKLKVAAEEKGLSIWETALKAPELQLGFHSGILNRLNEFTLMIQALGTELYKYNAFELGEKIVNKSGIRKFYFEDTSPESINRKENIEELLSGLKDFVMAPDEESGENTFRTLDEFMQDIALLTDADTKTKGPEDLNKVSLMTIHAAKGLEFPYVFIAGTEENLFPSQLSIGSRAELEEERRLFYVALTRAMRQATITWAETRFRYGNFNFCEPSRFIDELKPEFIEYLAGAKPQKSQQAKQETFSESLKNFRKVSEAKSQPTQSSPGPVANGDYVILTGAQLKPEMMVQHQRFGTGTVTQVEGNGPDAKATVIFEGFGKKQLLLKFARLKIVG
ncbi:MAG: 3'-5' exonuclease [Bacteroidales bacterium]|jgi:DNA helicase-2/ATP-dependent DNA helicase PcrA|nr:3'-5' exonuclease [Bacteroidales bacterium]